jgi:ERCC4-type nuclease
MLRSPAEHHTLLRTLGESSTLPETLGCDYLYVTNQGLVGVQRKRVDDLVASTRHDDRLSRELHQMRQLDQAVLLIEGDWGWNREGISTVVRGGYRRAEYQGLLLSVQSQGIWIVTTGSVEETSVMLVQMEGWFAKAQHSTLLARKKTRPGHEPKKAFALRVYQSVEGISYRRAETLYDTLGLVVGLTVPEAELAAVPGFGKVLVRRLLDAFKG